MQPNEKMLAILFADVSGSTRLYETLGDSQALGLITSCLARMRAAVEHHHGRVVKTVGDELICVLATADDAIRVASDIQSGLDTLRATEASVPAVRVGIHFGPVLEVGGDVFGDAVNLCARLVALAKGGQILASAGIVGSLSAFQRTSCRPLYAIGVKGKEEAVQVFEVVWKLDETLTMLSGTGMVARGLLQRLRLSHRQLEYLLDGNRRNVNVGRGSDNELVVEARTASRRHARVFVRDGKFVLADESANGTFVRFDRQGEMMLRREETVLVGRGVIGLGESTGAGGEDLISFEVETEMGSE